MSATEGGRGGSGTTIKNGEPFVPFVPAEPFSYSCTAWMIDLASNVPGTNRLNPLRASVGTFTLNNQTVTFLTSQTMWRNGTVMLDRYGMLTESSFAEDKQTPTYQVDNQYIALTFLRGAESGTLRVLLSASVRFTYGAESLDAFSTSEGVMDAPLKTMVKQGLFDSKSKTRIDLRMDLVCIPGPRRS